MPGSEKESKRKHIIEIMKYLKGVDLLLQLKQICCRLLRCKIQSIKLYIQVIGKSR